MIAVNRLELRVGGDRFTDAVGPGGVWRFAENGHAGDWIVGGNRSNEHQIETTLAPGLGWTSLFDAPLVTLSGYHSRIAAHRRITRGGLADVYCAAKRDGQ